MCAVQPLFRALFVQLKYLSEIDDVINDDTNEMDWCTQVDLKN